MSNISQYEVTYDILIEPRTDTFLGASRTDVQNNSMVVSANDPNTARRIVESMFGWNNVLVKTAYRIN